MTNNVVVVRGDYASAGKDWIATCPVKGCRRINFLDVNRSFRPKRITLVKADGSGEKYDTFNVCEHFQQLKEPGKPSSFLFKGRKETAAAENSKKVPESPSKDPNSAIPCTLKHPHPGPHKPPREEPPIFFLEKCKQKIPTDEMLPAKRKCPKCGKKSLERNGGSWTIAEYSHMTMECNYREKIYIVPTDIDYDFMDLPWGKRIEAMEKAVSEEKTFLDPFGPEGFIPEIWGMWYGRRDDFTADLSRDLKKVAEVYSHREKEPEKEPFQLKRPDGTFLIGGSWQKVRFSSKPVWGAVCPSCSIVSFYDKERKAVPVYVGCDHFVNFVHWGGDWKLGEFEFDPKQDNLEQRSYVCPFCNDLNIFRVVQKGQSRLAGCEHSASLMTDGSLKFGGRRGHSKYEEKSVEPYHIESPRDRESRKALEKGAYSVKQPEKSKEKKPEKPLLKIVKTTTSTATERRSQRVSRQPGQLCLDRFFPQNQSDLSEFYVMVRGGEIVSHPKRRS